MHSSVDQTEKWTYAEKDTKRTEPAAPLYEKIKTESTKTTSNYDKEKWSEEFFCELKGSGFALSWGTIFLVLVTAGLIFVGFRQEHFSKLQSRAYISGGGPHFRKDAQGQRSSKGYLTIENYGETPAFFKSAQWGLCPEEFFPKDIPVSKLLEENKLPMAIIKTVDRENVYPPHQETRIIKEASFVVSENIGKIFFGRFVYEDIFGDKHHSTFKLKIRPDGGSDPLPGSYSDWS